MNLKYDLEFPSRRLIICALVDGEIPVGSLVKAPKRCRARQNHMWEINVSHHCFSETFAGKQGSLETFAGNQSLFETVSGKHFREIFAVL